MRNMSDSKELAFLSIVLLLAYTSSAPTRDSDGLEAMVTGETRGLEIPTDLVAGIGLGTGAIQLVINVHTDSQGNIEVYTN